MWNQPVRAQNSRRSLHPLARELAGLLDPVTNLGFVPLFILVDVKVAGVLAFGADRGNGVQGQSAKERKLDVFGEAVIAEKPAPLF